MFKKLSKNKILIMCVLLTLIMCSFGIWKKIIDMSLFLGEDKSVHFDLLTVNSIIAGFMFSGLSLIIGMSNSKTVQELERAKHMDRIYTNIITGIVFNVFSIIISLVVLLRILTNVEIYLVSLEIMFLVVGIVCFGLSVIDLRFLIHSIRGEVKKIDDNTINDINNVIKNSKINR
jgi:hypothetical protein